MQWKPVIFLPANLTVEYGATVLTASDPGPWCRKRAIELLGPRASGRQAGRLEQCLEDYARYFKRKSQVVHAALFFYPDFTHIPPRGEAQVFLLGEDPVTGPMTLARAREIFGSPDESSFGEREITEAAMPAGPAVRVHRYVKLEPGKRRSRIAEEAGWIICPPGSTQAVMMITTWEDPAFSKAGITIADDMASNFRIKPAE